MIFLWYSQITETSFNRGVTYVKNTVISLNKLFVEEMRRTGVNALLGKDITQKGIPHQIEFIFTGLTIAMIGVGIITFLKKYKEMSVIANNSVKPEYMSAKFDIPYMLMALICVGLMIMVVIIPFVSTGYDLDRVYSVAIIVLSVFPVIGGIAISKFLKLPSFSIFLIILLIYFLCVSGFVYSLFSYPRNVILNSEGENQYDYLYIFDQEISSAKWLKNYSLNNETMYSDWYGTNRLVSQGMINSSAYPRNFIERKTDLPNGYLYLRYKAVVDGKLMDRGYTWHNITDYYPIFSGKNFIYSNGGSDVWY
jgi:uncharacterized membrane protein